MIDNWEVKIRIEGEEDEVERAIDKIKDAITDDELNVSLNVGVMYDIG